MANAEEIEIQKEIFLRENIISIYLFAAKTLITLASATLALSVGIQGLLDGEKSYKLTLLLISGWGFILFSIVLTAYAVKTGIEILYTYYNNIVSHKPEIDKNTASAETKMWMCISNGFISYILGIIFILWFIYYNFLH